jgi:hypothetical protein
MKGCTLRVVEVKNHVSLFLPCHYCKGSEDIRQTHPLLYEFKAREEKQKRQALGVSVFLKTEGIGLIFYQRWWT